MQFRRVGQPLAGADDTSKHMVFQIVLNHLDEAYMPDISNHTDVNEGDETDMQDISDHEGQREEAYMPDHMNMNSTSGDEQVMDHLNQSPRQNDNILEEQVMDHPNQSPRQNILIEARPRRTTRSKCVVPVESVRSTVKKRPKSSITRTKRGQKVGGTRIDSIPEASDLVPDSITETHEGPLGLNSEAAASPDHLNKNATSQHDSTNNDSAIGEASHTLNEVLSGIKKKKEKIKQLKNIILDDKAPDLVNTLVHNLAYQDLFLEFPSKDHAVNMTDLCDSISTAYKDLFSTDNGNLDPLRLSETIRTYVRNTVYLDMLGGQIFFSFSDCRQEEILAEINNCRTELIGLEAEKDKLVLFSC